MGEIFNWVAGGLVAVLILAELGGLVWRRLKGTASTGGSKRVGPAPAAASPGGQLIDSYEACLRQGHVKAIEQALGDVGASEMRERMSKAFSAGMPEKKS